MKSSRIHIPAIFHELMTSQDSPIIDFYPENFEIDMNGKKMAWQGVALLPFIEEQRLLEAMALKYPGLNEAEIKRNGWGSNSVFVNEEHPLFPTIESLYTKTRRTDVRSSSKLINTQAHLFLRSRFRLTLKITKG